MAEIERIPKPWERDLKEIVITMEVVLQWFLFELRSKEIDFRFSGKQCLQFVRGIWREDEASAAIDRELGAFCRMLGATSLNKAKPRKEIEGDKIHSNVLKRAHSELYMRADQFDAEHALVTMPSRSYRIVEESEQ